MRIFKFDKNTEPSLTVLYISSLILTILKNNDEVPYQELRSLVLNKSSSKADYLIPYAISFLYTINKIEYKCEIDSFSLKVAA